MKHNYITTEIDGEPITLVLGQTVWHTGGYYFNKGKLVEGKITKLGNKYIYVDGDRYKFRVSDLREDTQHGSAGSIYPDKQKYLDKQELSKNIRKLRNYFSDWNCRITLEDAREVMSILGLEVDQ